MIRASLIIVVFLLFTGCQSRTPVPPASALPPLAVINGHEIALEEFQQYFEKEKWKFGEGPILEEKITQTRQEIFDDFIKDVLLRQEAEKRNIVMTDEEVTQSHLGKRGLLIQKLTDQIAQQEKKITPEVIQHYYKENVSKFWHPEEVRARQIVTDSQEKAKAIREMLAGGESFEAVALKYSMSPDRKSGGNLGWFARGAMPPEFDQICFALPVMEMSEVIKTPYGYHIFQVLERHASGFYPFEEVKEKIRAELMQKEGRQIFQNWYGQLRADAKVEVSTKLMELIK
ncbi:MAG: peptidyl-prolyl cis-trans isomerase [Deltaproteobacteria bacterium]|nr:peptidyl-prolyl cis-trans isomerase [Deltaproteobacteria bacterium]